MKLFPTSFQVYSKCKNEQCPSYPHVGLNCKSSSYYLCIIMYQHIFRAIGASNLDGKSPRATSLDEVSPKLEFLIPEIFFINIIYIEVPLRSPPNHIFIFWKPLKLVRFGLYRFQLVQMDINWSITVGIVSYLHIECAIMELILDILHSV